MKRQILLLSMFLFGLQLLAQDNTVKIYIAPQIGNGTFEDPFRSLINNYIDVSAGEGFTEIDNPARRYSICAVTAQPITHAAITADPSVISLTPIDVTAAELAAQLDQLVSSLPLSFRNNVQAALEAHGISFAWVGATNTVRDVFRYLLRVHFFSQMADGEGNANVLAFIRANLDSTVQQLSAAQRNAAKTWMESKGLPTGWITNSTTVRQVIHSIVQDLGFGLISLGGQGF